MSLSTKGMPRPGGGATPKILISISATNPTYILHTMPKDIQEHMCALIAQHDSALTALVAFWRSFTKVLMNTCKMWNTERF